MRAFRDITCAAYNTYELPSEEAARGRRNAALTAYSQPGGDERRTGSEKKKKQFNLNTYKFHSLGDYANTIRKFGTIENTSTQQVILTNNLYCVLTFL